MRRIGPSSEDEMIATWLREEILASERFSSRIIEILEQMGVDIAVVREPDLSDPGGNALRKEVFRQYRGYLDGKDDYLSSFPTGVKWQRVALTSQELLSVLYIDWDYWLKLSGGSRRPQDGAKAVLAGVTVYDVSNDAFKEIAAAVRSGQRFPPIILITSGEPDAPVVVIEGHARLTGYLLAADALRGETEALLGTASAFKDWWAY